MCTFKCCGGFCALLSIFCGLALAITGAFLWAESPSFHIPLLEGETVPNYGRAAENCFVGAAIYAVTFILSLGCIFWGRFKSNKTPPPPSASLHIQQQ